MHSTTLLSILASAFAAVASSSSSSSAPSASTSATSDALNTVNLDKPLNLANTAEVANEKRGLGVSMAKSAYTWCSALLKQNICYSCGSSSLGCSSACCRCGASTSISCSTC